MLQRVRVMSAQIAYLLRSARLAAVFGMGQQCRSPDTFTAFAPFATGGENTKAAELVWRNGEHRQGVWGAELPVSSCGCFCGAILRPACELVNEFDQGVNLRLRQGRTVAVPADFFYLFLAAGNRHNQQRRGDACNDLHKSHSFEFRLTCTWSPVRLMVAA